MKVIDLLNKTAKKDKDMPKSEADEIFEKLEYIKNEKPIKWGGREIPYICYHDAAYYKTIKFDLESRLVHVSCVGKDYKKVLEAINEKVKELGWDE